MADLPCMLVVDDSRMARSEVLARFNTLLALSHAQEKVSVKLGCDLTNQVSEVGARFGKILAGTGKVPQEDSLGHFVTGQYTIVASGTPDETAICHRVGYGTA